MTTRNQNSEQFYIMKRKAKAFIRSLAYDLCRVFPVKKNKVVFWAFEGTRGYCCSPKYIAEEMLKRQQTDGQKYEMIWLMDDISQECPSEIKKVKSTQWSRAYHLSTSKVWVSNTRTFYDTRKRKNQTYIQTWHGTICIKPIGKYRGELFPKIAYLVSKHDSDMADYVLSGSDWCDTHYRDGLVYDGEILRTGTPRCDILFNRREQMKEQIRKEYEVPKGAHILMYAPTFRGGSQSTNRTVAVKQAALDFTKLIAVLEQQFGGEWYVFLRLHPQLAAKKKTMQTNETSNKVIDVTMRQDMNELIAGVDAFITDYSSAVFEAMLLRIPCFIYADDLEEYIEERGDLFWDMEQLPFPLALTGENLLEKVRSFEEAQYLERLDRFIKQEGIVEDGRASERVADLIEKICRG